MLRVRRDRDRDDGRSPTAGRDPTARRWSRRPTCGGALGMAAVSPRVAAAGARPGSADPRRRGDDPVRDRGVQHDRRRGRRRVRHRDAPAHDRRHRCGSRAARCDRRRGVVRRGRRHRYVAAARPGFGRDGQVSGPGPGRALQRSDAGAAAGALPQRRPRDRADGRGRRDLPDRRRRHFQPRWSRANRRRPGGEPQRPQRGVRTGGSGLRRVGGIGDDPCRRKPGEIRVVPGGQRARRRRRDARIPVDRQQRDGRRGHARRSPAGPGARGARCGCQLRRRGAASPAAAGHARVDRRDAAAPASGGRGQRRRSRRRGRRPRWPAWRDGVDRGRPANGERCRVSDRPVQRCRGGWS